MAIPSSPCSDEDWARKAALGDHAAFSELVRKYSDRFFAVAYRLLRNGDEAEEIVQNAYLKFWQDPKKFNPQKNTKWSTWFYRVVVNACLDRLGKRGREVSQESFEIHPDAAPSVESNMAEREQHQALNKALGELPERQRAALTLCFWEGLSNQEAADVLGLRLKALQSSIGTPAQKPG
ncbi:MAG: sigma-70 family RNA polymerase sigma factor [Deltaproteobacteria bacterium]|nr:sigma-70 family RNA polymerase sigma factor [Deltaproteobacteria bacterium]